MSQFLHDMNPFYFLRRDRPQTWMGRIFKSQLPYEIQNLRVLWNFWFAPETLHLINKNNAFPKPEGRVCRLPDPLDEFEIIEDWSDEMNEVDVAHVVMKGASFDRSQIASLNGRVFLLNWSVDDPVDHPDVVYMAGDQYHIHHYIVNGMFPVLAFPPADVRGGTPKRLPWVSFLAPIIDHPQVKVLVPHWKSGATMSGAGPYAIFTAASFSKKVIVHGWDCYQPKPLHKLPTFMALLSIMRSAGNRTYDGYIPSSLHQWLYAARLKNHVKVQINGNLVGVEKHTAVLKRLESIYYLA